MRRLVLLFLVANLLTHHDASRMLRDAAVDHDLQQIRNRFEQSIHRHDKPAPDLR
jgi:hypothetical protein